MLQTVEAIIDTRGRVSLLESVKIKKKSRALVTILDDEKDSLSDEMTLFGSMELLDEDLEGASRQIAEMLNASIEKSAKELDE